MEMEISKNTTQEAKTVNYSMGGYMDVWMLNYLKKTNIKQRPKKTNFPCEYDMTQDSAVCSP